jgi:hypothetical protein
MNFVASIVLQFYLAWLSSNISGNTHSTSSNDSKRQDGVINFVYTKTNLKNAEVDALKRSGWQRLWCVTSLVGMGYVQRCIIRR